MAMKYFFVAIFAIFAAIYLLFKPLELAQSKSGEIASLNIFDFTMYEFSAIGLSSILKGVEANRFSDRYTIKSPIYTDNTGEFLSHLSSIDGLYKNDILYLNKDVKYTRDDGLKYFSQEATYDTKSKIATTKKDFEAFMGKNRAIGDDLKYNNEKNTLKAKNVFITYNIERKK